MSVLLLLIESKVDKFYRLEFSANTGKNIKQFATA